MESRAKFLGHPVHPMLIVFPLGLLATSLAFDIAYLSTGDAVFGSVSFWMIAAGICGALVAAFFGVIDWLAIPSATRAKAVGLGHGAGNLLVTLLFIVSWFLRRPAPDHPGPAPIALSVIAVLLALITAWLGGELVDRLGVGVDDGAHLNAPSSLSRRSAAENASSRSPHPGTRIA